MKDKKKSERSFLKFKAEATFIKDVENYIKEYVSPIPKIKLSKKVKLKSLSKILNKFINEI